MLGIWIDLFDGLTVGVYIDDGMFLIVQSTIIARMGVGVDSGSYYWRQSRLSCTRESEPHDEYGVRSSKLARLKMRIDQIR